jgi:hypothetical protein
MLFSNEGPQLHCGFPQDPSSRLGLFWMQQAPRWEKMAPTDIQLILLLKLAVDVWHPVQD